MNIRPKGVATWTVRDTENVSTPDKVIARFNTRHAADNHAYWLNAAEGHRRYRVRSEPV